MKLSLEAADMDMPDPIYRVQLSDARSHAAAGAVTIPNVPVASRKKRASASRTDVDTARVSDLDEQITEDRKMSDSEDLLSPTAPKE